TKGNPLIDWSKLKADDIVIIPAFGTTLETEAKLRSIGIDPLKYNTTCPFVEKVWKRSDQLGDQQYSVVIHGKASHEETRATFSHTVQKAPAVVLRDLPEAELLGRIILGEEPIEKFEEHFRSRASAGFDPIKHFDRIGVVNQTTMLATETQAIADHLKQVMIRKYGEADIRAHFADTRDTLCYATNDNQDATNELLKVDADLALVIGGYNSSNTSHLAELLEERFPTYFIKGEEEILSSLSIQHFNYPAQRLELSNGWLPANRPLTIILTSGASCPDTMLDRVMLKVLSYVEGAQDPIKAVERMTG
ncbi:MAG: 4-hydroxy-3-methylbut-2-enyl diphosphate reductase, partial [Bacteroidota bacterium]|nr:4-hydroxy-3-methylbut-2-enyl diphosphate reductase [Bacteroidota bacterium]